MSAIRRVIAGVSGSHRSLPALRYAAALAREHGTVLIPLLTWTPPGGELAAHKCPSGNLSQTWEDAAWNRLWNAIGLALGGWPPDVEIQPLVVRGQAGWVLVHAAGRAGDMLVVGSGRHGTMRRLAGGRVSRYCLARAACPVVAVPPSRLELEAGHGLHAWALRRRGLTVAS